MILKEKGKRKKEKKKKGKDKPNLDPKNGCT